MTALFCSGLREAPKVIVNYKSPAKIGTALNNPNRKLHATINYKENIMDINTTIFALAALLAFTSDSKLKRIEKLLVRVCQILGRK